MNLNVPDSGPVLRMDMVLYRDDGKAPLEVLVRV